VTADASGPSPGQSPTVSEPEGRGLAARSWMHRAAATLDRWLDAVGRAARDAGGWLPRVDFQWAAGLVAVLGVLLYLLLRALASQFYTPLGLTVEDIGLGQIPLLARSAFGLFVVAGIYGSAWLSLVVAVRVAPPMSTSSSSWGELWWFGFAGVLLVVASLVGYGFAQAGSETGELASVAVGLNAALLLVGPVARPWVEGHPRRYRVASALALVVFMGYGMFSLFDTAREQADVVLAGRAPVEEIERVPLMPYRTHIAYVRDATSGGAPERCVIYLGESPTAVVIYDPAAERSEMLGADTEVAIDPSRYGCPPER
jgi:hypothetical protein